MTNRTSKLDNFLLSFVAVLVLITIVGIFSPFGGHDRIMTNHMRAVSSMRQLIEGERKYATAHPSSGFACELKFLHENDSQAFVDKVLAEGEKAGYRFRVRDCSPRLGGRVEHFVVTAEPLGQQVGHWSFCSSEEGVLLFSKDGSVERCISDKQPWVEKRDHYK